MGKGPGGGTTTSQQSSICSLYLYFFPYQSLPLLPNQQGPHPLHPPSQAAEFWCLLHPPHCKQLELLPVQTAGGHQSQLALGWVTWRGNCDIRAGVQLECHRAVFSSSFYGCCILSLLTGRIPDPVCSPFLSSRKCYHVGHTFLISNLKKMLKINCHLNKAKKQESIGTVPGPVGEDWWMELWSLDHTGGFIIVIWGFTTADRDSFCPFWYMFCWAQKFNLCLSLSWLYLDFRAGMEEVAQPQSLELGQAAHWTASASTSLCTQGAGVWSWNVARIHLHQGDGMHLCVPGIRHSQSLPVRRWSEIIFTSAVCLSYDSSFTACPSVSFPSQSTCQKLFNLK